ncbi:hypothetical protein GCM10023353_34690 [Tomitella cavernea]|uniref:Aldehyde dehydrogenase domain-containing protein n=1 Tax=Tomitella cavernea TaxID=1387982 RepID=A0ABP9D160_9ACTN
MLLRPDVSTDLLIDGKLVPAASGATFATYNPATEEPRGRRRRHIEELREAAGVAAAITPWNFPHRITLAKIGPALAAGCTITTRMLVPRHRLDEATAAAATALTDLKPGDPAAPGTVCRPLISELQRERVESYLALAVEEGGTVVCGGRRPPGCERGYFLEPTLIAGLGNTARAAREEIFGPVLVIVPHDGDKDAVRIANDSPPPGSPARCGATNRPASTAWRVESAPARWASTGGSGSRPTCRSAATSSRGSAAKHVWRASRRIWRRRRWRMPSGDGAAAGTGAGEQDTDLPNDVAAPRIGYIGLVSMGGPMARGWWCTRVPPTRNGRDAHERDGREPGCVGVGSGRCVAGRCVAGRCVAGRCAAARCPGGWGPGGWARARHRAAGAGVGQDERGLRL